MSSVLTRRLRDIPEWAWLTAIVCLGFAMRLAGLSKQSLWFDEAFSWLVAQQPAMEILTQHLEPILPPLYHFTLHFWLAVGESEVVLRLLSVLCGVVTIPVIYALGRRLFASATGLGAAFLTAILPFQVYFSQEARLYSLVILLSALMLWAFVRAWKRTRYATWIVFGLLAGLSFYAHLFVIFALAVFHGFALLEWRRDLGRWRGLLLADLVTMVVAGPLLPSAWAQTRQVTTNFWLAVPSPLDAIKTLDFLLFGHTTPIWLVPIALFLTLTIIILVAWAAWRVRGEARRWLVLLLALVLVPLLLALVLSWVVGPIYLDRSFALATPAYVLVLSWGFVYAPRRSPLRLLYGGLAIVVAISLGNHYLKPDPAKPPFREVGDLLNANWQERDVLLNLHDSSYLPLRYYAPKSESYLLNNDPDTWLPSYTWEWAGQRVSALDPVVDGRSRLWLAIMPARLNERQRDILEEVESRYPMEREWTWSSVDPPSIRLYLVETTDTGG